jgi:hypothetical protein
MPDGSWRALHSDLDCAYARARSALVPEALRLANEKVESLGRYDRHIYYFNLYMERLVHQNNL